MRVKSFFTASVAEANSQARKELGNDAVLLNSRKVPDGDDRVRYEVVFGVDEAVPPVVALRAPSAPAAPPALPSPETSLSPRAAAILAQRRAASAPASAAPVAPALPPAPAAPPTPAAPAVTATAHPAGAYPAELDAIRKQIDDLRAALGATPAGTAVPPVAAPQPRPKPVPESTLLAAWRDRLSQEDCRPRMVSEILSAVQEQVRADARMAPPAPARVDFLVRDEISRRLPPPVKVRANTVVLVGPPGAGKTTTLVKLAVQLGLAAGRSVHIISCDPHRAVGGDVLRSYASILGVTFDHVDTFGGFMAAMKKGRQRDLVLVDTPGYAAAESELARELAGFFECFEDIETHLVLSASMKGADLSRCVEQYAVFQPASAIFTRLDETTTFGTLLSVSILHRLAVSFLAAGQSIPDDLQAATLSGLTERICGPAALAESVA